MTIKKGHDWGTVVPRPPDLLVVLDDAAFATALADDPQRPIGLAGGDMFQTVGARPLGTRTELLALPLDTITVRLDDGSPIVGVAHAIVRRPWWRGGALRGPLLAIMNAEFVGRFDVAPRGHPNDGRVEVLCIDTTMTLRQRLALRRRLPTATHLPHPLIDTRSVRSHEWEFGERLQVFVDGVTVGSCARLALTVESDAAVLYA